MAYKNPLKKSKASYKNVIGKISSKKSAVGIDAQFTHAIIIDYLEQLTQRVAKIEDYLKRRK